METVTSRPIEAGGPVTGTFPTNRETTHSFMPIWGHYARNNDVFIYGNDQLDAYLNLSAWQNPAEEVLYTEVRSGSEDDDTNDFDNDNSPYLEPGATSWNEMFAAVAIRHFDGSVVGYADGHAKWQKLDWFRSSAGKLALNRECANIADATFWPGGPPAAPCN